MEPRESDFSSIVLFEFPENALKWSSLVRAKSSIKLSHSGQAVNIVVMTSDGSDDAVQ